MPHTPIDAEQARKLRLFAERLMDANKTMNLVKVDGIEMLETRHIQDSLAALKLPRVRNATRMLDLGTGGGLPGLPLAIALPRVKFTLVDGTSKKIRVLSEIIDELEIRNATAVAGRAEILAHQPAYRQTFDVVTARAVAPLDVLIERAAPFCKPGGALVAFKGIRLHEELKTARALFPQLQIRGTEIVPYSIGDRSFYLAVFEIGGLISSRYPRGQVSVKPRRKKARKKSGMSVPGGTPRKRSHGKPHP